VTLRFWIRTLEPVFLLGLALAFLVAWRANRRDRAQLASELAATKQVLAAASAGQHDRDAQLSKTLSALSAQKRKVKTPAQIVRELPREIGLPAPIVLQSVGVSASIPNPTDKHPAPDATHPDSEKRVEAQAAIPAQDLKPLYDFTIDCKACQARLSAARADLTDEKTKTTALTKERDHALQIARGGSPFRRIARATKWFLIGAAAGALAAKSVR
jgi:hypothetical protein